MATYTAQQEQARSDQRFRKDKLKSDYDAYLAQLATQYGLSTESLSSNLEARGILNSGEAGTARTRLAATNETNKTNAKSDYDYNRGLTRIDLLKELAALKSGTAVPAATAPKDTVPPVEEKPIAVAPTNIGNGMTYSNTGVYGAVYPTATAPKMKKTTIKPIGAKFR